MYEVTLTNHIYPGEKFCVPLTELYLHSPRLQKNTFIVKTTETDHKLYFVDLLVIYQNMNM